MASEPAKVFIISKDLFLEYRDRLGEAGLSSRSINQTFKICSARFG
jgi:hypothetical protein